MFTKTGPRFDDSPAVALHGVTKRFGARIAVDRLWLKVRPGEVCGLLGANGSGKSTSLRLIAGLLQPDEGEGLVLGHDLRRAAHAVRHQVGYIAQRSTLYATLSVRENLRFRAAAFGVRNPRAAAETQMRAFDLTAFADARVADLSGGWSRRVELSAVMIHSPRLLLLDEPTTGLEAMARQAIWARLTALALRQTAIVFSTHDVSEAQRCSQVLLLSDGRVCASGSPEVVAAQPTTSAGSKH